MDSVAVLLAVCNGQRWIYEQLESIIRQKEIDLHIFISVDVSVDNTPLIIQDFAQKNNSFVTLLPYGAKFGAAAPNFYRLLTEVDFSKYDFVSLSDQDDIWLETKLIAAIRNISKMNCVGYSSNVTVFWADGKKKEIIKAAPQKKYDFLFEGPGPGCSFLLKTSFAQELQSYLRLNNVLLSKLDWHDWLIYAYARSKNNQWFIDSQSYLLYRQHTSNQLGANSGLKPFKRRVHDILSGYGISQTLYTIQFLGLQRDPFVRKWIKCSRLDYLRLARHATQCRRQVKDQILFFVSCILMACKKTPREGV